MQTDNALVHQLLFDSNPLSIAWVDAQETYRAINVKYSKFFGIERASAIHKPIREVLGEDLYIKIKEKIDKALQGETIEYDAVTFNSSGKKCHIQSKLVPFKGPTGARDGFLVFMDDVTERKLSEIRQQDLQLQLMQAQKLESIGILAGGVAHDFNNMLGVILGHASLAAQNLEANDPAQNHLKEIINSAQRSATLTKQLLTFSRKEKNNPKIIDLNDSINEILKLVHRLIGENITIIWEPYPKKLPILIDPTQLDQLIMNICINARDAIIGIGNITITAKVERVHENIFGSHELILAGKYVKLQIADNGSGMSENVLENLFEPFFTTKSTGKGTGLGLATVLGVVKQNNGFINVKSSPSQGSRFNIYFPFCNKKTFKQKINREHQEKRACSGLILLVEDEKMVMNLTKEILDEQGYEVIAMNSPTKAIEFIKQEPKDIDLLITDVVMPEMNGIELSRQVHKIMPNTMVLFISGYSGEITQKEGLTTNEATFLRKPFSMQSLLKSVAATLHA